MRAVFITISILSLSYVAYSLGQIKSLKRSIQSVKEELNELHAQKQRHTSSPIDLLRKQGTQTTYDNKQILSVLDYLQQEIDDLKNKAESRQLDNASPSMTQTAQQTKSESFPARNSSDYDLNNDGYLSKQEAQLSQFDFESYDTNRDGKISNQENASALKRLDKAHQHAQKRDSADGSFPIEQSSWSRSQKEFNYIDKNNDLSLDESEYVNYLSFAKQELRRFDYNRDAWISFEEYGQGQVRYGQIDSDQDQKIYEHEVRRALYQGFW